MARTKRILSFVFLTLFFGMGLHAERQMGASFWFNEEWKLPSSNFSVEFDARISHQYFAIGLANQRVINTSPLTVTNDMKYEIALRIDQPTKISIRRLGWQEFHPDYKLSKEHPEIVIPNPKESIHYRFTLNGNRLQLAFVNAQTGTWDIIFDVQDPQFDSTVGSCNRLSFRSYNGTNLLYLDNVVISSDATPIDPTAVAWTVVKSYPAPAPLGYQHRTSIALPSSVVDDRATAYAVSFTARLKDLQRLAFGLSSQLVHNQPYTQWLQYYLLSLYQDTAGTREHTVSGSGTGVTNPVSTNTIAGDWPPTQLDKNLPIPLWLKVEGTNVSWGYGDTIGQNIGSNAVIGSFADANHIAFAALGTGLEQDIALGNIKVHRLTTPRVGQEAIAEATSVAFGQPTAISKPQKYEYPAFSNWLDFQTGTSTNHEYKYPLADNQNQAYTLTFTLPVFRNDIVTFGFTTDSQDKPNHLASASSDTSWSYFNRLTFSHYENFAYGKNHEYETGGTTNTGAKSVRGSSSMGFNLKNWPWLSTTFASATSSTTIKVWVTVEANKVTWGFGDDPTGTPQDSVSLNTNVLSLFKNFYVMYKSDGRTRYWDYEATKKQYVQNVAMHTQHRIDTVFSPAPVDTGESRSLTPRSFEWGGDKKWLMPSNRSQATFYYTQSIAVPVDDHPFNLLTGVGFATTKEDGTITSGLYSIGVVNGGYKVLKGTDIIAQGSVPSIPVSSTKLGFKLTADNGTFSLTYYLPEYSAYAPILTFTDTTFDPSNTRLTYLGFAYDAQSALNKRGSIDSVITSHLPLTPEDRQALVDAEHEARRAAAVDAAVKAQMANVTERTEALMALEDVAIDSEFAEPLAYQPIAQATEAEVAELQAAITAYNEALQERIDAKAALVTAEQKRLAAEEEAVRLAAEQAEAERVAAEQAEVEEQRVAQVTADAQALHAELTTQLAALPTSDAIAHDTTLPEEVLYEPIANAKSEDEEVVAYQQLIETYNTALNTLRDVKNDRITEHQAELSEAERVREEEERVAAVTAAIAIKQTTLATLSGNLPAADKVTRETPLPAEQVYVAVDNAKDEDEAVIAYKAEIEAFNTARAELAAVKQARVTEYENEQAAEQERLAQEQEETERLEAERIAAEEQAAQEQADQERVAQEAADKLQVVSDALQAKHDEVVALQDELPQSDSVTHETALPAQLEVATIDGYDALSSEQQQTLQARMTAYEQLVATYNQTRDALEAVKQEKVTEYEQSQVNEQVTADATRIMVKTIEQGSSLPKGDQYANNLLESSEGEPVGKKLIFAGHGAQGIDIAFKDASDVVNTLSITPSGLLMNGQQFNDRAEWKWQVMDTQDENFAIRNQVYVINISSSTLNGNPAVQFHIGRFTNGKPVNVNDKAQLTSNTYNGGMPVGYKVNAPRDAVQFEWLSSTPEPLPVEAPKKESAPTQAPAPIKASPFSGGSQTVLQNAPVVKTFQHQVAKTNTAHAVGVRS